MSFFGYSLHLCTCMICTIHVSFLFTLLPTHTCVHVECLYPHQCTCSCQYLHRCCCVSVIATTYRHRVRKYMYMYLHVVLVERRDVCCTVFDQCFIQSPGKGEDFPPNLSPPPSPCIITDILYMYMYLY